MHPARDQAGLTIHGRVQKCQIWLRVAFGAGIMAVDDIVGESPDRFDIAPRCEILERADPNMARGDPRQHRARQRAVPVDALSDRRRGKRPRGRDPQRVHGFAHQVFAQHWTQSRAAVAAAGESCPAGAFQLKIAGGAVAVDDVAQKDRAAIAKLGDEVAELVARVSQRDRPGAGRHDVAGEQRGHIVVQQIGQIEAQLLRERRVELQQARAPNDCRRRVDKKLLRQPGVAILKCRDPWRCSSSISTLGL